jgi:hypothetical protein
MYMDTNMNEEHMTDDLHDYFKVKENCFNDLNEARQKFGSTHTTEAEYDALEKGLGIMYLHCPEDLQDMVLATMHEATARRVYHEMRWQKEAEAEAFENADKIRVRTLSMF